MNGEQTMPTDDTSSIETQDVHEFFAKDPLEADRAFFGRESYSDRRGFLRGAGLTTMAAMVGAAIPFHRNMPAGLIPAAFADENLLVGKDGLTLLNDRPPQRRNPAPPAGRFRHPRPPATSSATTAFRPR